MRFGREPLSLCSARPRIVPCSCCRERSSPCSSRGSLSAAGMDRDDRPSLWLWHEALAASHASPRRVIAAHVRARRTAAPSSTQLEPEPAPPPRSLASWRRLETKAPEQAHRTAQSAFARALAPLPAPSAAASRPPRAPDSSCSPRSRPTLRQQGPASATKPTTPQRHEPPVRRRLLSLSSRCPSCHVERVLLYER